MSDHQLQLPFDAWSEARRDWAPSDAQATPVRAFDTPVPAIATSAFGKQCVECGRPFVPDIDGQHRCAHHQLAYDTEQARRAELERGPEPRA